jgi:hypothetical protein
MLALLREIAAPVCSMLAAGAESMADERLIYSSENGDQWVLAHEFGTARPVVRHIANPSSGGQITDTAVEEFLGRGKSGPEHLALRQLLSEPKPSVG